MAFGTALQMIETGTGLPLGICALIILNLMLLFTLAKGLELTAMLGMFLNSLLAAFCYWMTTEHGATSWNYVYPLALSILWLIVMAFTLFISDDRWSSTG